MTDPGNASEEAPVRTPQGFLTGVAWMLGFRVLDRSAAIISTLILARLLLPEHFGIVALAATVVAFVELLGALGLDTVLIQRRELSRGHYDTAWTIQVCVACVCATLLAIIAHAASEFFREPRLEAIIYMLSASILVEGFQNIRLVDFRREMRFDREFLFLGCRRIIGLAVTIVAALSLRNHWALAIGIAASKLVGVGLSYGLRPYVPRFSLEHRGEFVGKSSWILTSNIAMFIRNRTSDVMVGRVRGAAAVGAYGVASDVANLVGQELIAPINRVALSDFSRQAEAGRLRDRFDGLTGQVAIIVAPLGAGLSATAELVVPVLFGPGWTAAVGVLQLLAWAAVVAALASNIGTAFVSLGHFRVNMAVHAIGAVVLVPLAIFGVKLAGPTGAAAAVLVGNCITVITSLIYSKRILDYGPVQFALRIWRPVVAATVMFLSVRWVMRYLLLSEPLMGDVLRLVLLVGFGMLLYPLLVFLFWLGAGRPEGAERSMASLINRLAKGALRRRA